MLNQESLIHTSILPTYFLYLNYYQLDTMMIIQVDDETFHLIIQEKSKMEKFSVVNKQHGEGKQRVRNSNLHQGMNEKSIKLITSLIAFVKSCWCLTSS